MDLHQLHALPKCDSAFAKFVTSVMEVSRYGCILLGKTICQLCHKGMESEEHYVCHRTVFMN